MGKHTDPPADLDADSRRLFRRLVSDLRAQGDGAESDLLLLAEALRMRARLAQVRAKLAEDGPVVAGSKGQPRAHPLVAVEAGLARDLRQAMDQLTLSPSKRTGAVNVTAAGRLVDEYADLYDDEDQ